MSMIWGIVVLLAVLLYLGYRWQKARKPALQQRPKLPTASSQLSQPGSASSPFSQQPFANPTDRFKGAQSSAIPLQASSLPTFPDLAVQLRELATQAWTTEESLRRSQLLLNPADFVNVTSPTQVVEILIRHARQIVPGFSVPQMVPRVQVVSLPAAAGMFKVDEDGWVTIELGQNFFQDKLAAQAILAHEVCHYILENSGIRKSDVNLNERYTDLCMFICGFGELFLAGYRREAAQQDYRPGHRLGYLTDAEYHFSHRYVMQLRQSGEIAPPQALDRLKKRLLHLCCGDLQLCSRLIEYERRKKPHKPDVELYQDAIDRLERDQGR